MDLISILFTFMVATFACDVGVEVVLQANKVWRLRKK